MLAFVGVALLTVTTLAGIAAATSAEDVSELVSRHQVALDRAAAASAGAIWRHSRSWDGVSLRPLLYLADEAGIAVQVRDSAGDVVGTSPDFGSLDPHGQSRLPVVVAGQQVGSMTVRFSDKGSSAAENRLVPDLLKAMGLAGAVAALLATLVAFGLARQLASPVRRLAEVAYARGRGDRGARAGAVSGPREIRELAASFDEMADFADREETLRRNLIADISHELRTPAAILVASSEALIDGIAKPSPAQLASLHDEAGRLSVLIDDLQRLSSAEAASLELTMTECDLAEVAAVAADALDDSFDQAGVSLARRLEPVGITANAGRLHEVIMNLLTNALKYTPTGGSALLEVAPAADRALLRITDTGVGIPAEELPKIFDRFFRGRQAARLAPGTGIGMTVVAALVQAQGGDIEVRSRPGRGTEMTITFPSRSGVSS
jgi:signal transduction histidine kinase